VKEKDKFRPLKRREFFRKSLSLAAIGLLPRLPQRFPAVPYRPPKLLKRIYLAPDDHTDYFWSAGEEAYKNAFVEMIDYYLDLADATSNNRREHQSRWNCDGSYWLWTYEKRKTAQEFERLINRIRDGHISFPLNALVVCLGGAPAEAVLRGMYYAGKIERRYGLRFPMAISMENQTLPYGLGSLWAGAGAQFSWKGICGCDSRVPTAGDREHEIYWWGGPDGSRILMKWNSMLGNMKGGGQPNQGMGGYAEARYPSSVVEYVDADPLFIARYPYRIIGAFGHGWDDFKTLSSEFIAVAKYKTTSERMVIVSNEQDFFRDFEVNYGATLPTIAASFGNEWDLYCAALSEVSARVKRSVEKLRGAEALATLVSYQDPGFMDGRRASRDQAWMDLGLFWEHNFGMVSPPSGLTNARVLWQRRLASEVETYVDKLGRDAANRLGGMIRKSGSNPRFYAFNPLSWVRTDYADLPYMDTSPFHVIDLSTGQETPSQIIRVGGQRLLRILARDVPPVGYKVFEVRPGAGKSLPPAAMVIANIMENQFYRVTVEERGAISSLIDKNRGNREFAASIGGRLVNDLGPGAGSLRIESSGPVSTTLLAAGLGPLGHTTRITLFCDIDRIDIRNDINQNFDELHTWGFSFLLDTPTVWHEEVGAVICARLLAQGGHYSPRNARYDWLTLNHFADMSGPVAGITISNADCYFMKLGSSTTSVLDAQTPQISVLAGGRVVNGNNGLPGQGGDSHFMQRFAMKTHDGFNAARAMKFALEHQNPLLCGVVRGGSAYPEVSFSLLSISNPNTLLWALKPAEDGRSRGVIARVWNMAGSRQDFSLTVSTGALRSAQRVTHIETVIEPANFSGGMLMESCEPRQLRSFRLDLGEPI
jgi:alpha-mannosidase